MDIGRLRSNGWIERPAEKPKAPDAGRAGDSAGAGRSTDSASISSRGRDTAAAAAALTERARSEGGDRDAKVAAAKARLAAGELDGKAVHEAVAAQLLRSGFRSA